MIKKIDHIVITTDNIEKCKKFYALLGFDVREGGGRYELFVGDFKINVHILGSELKPNAKNVQVGSADICFETTEDLDKVANRLQSVGIELLTQVVTRSGARGVMRSIYLRDYDGNLIELSSYE